MDDKAVDKQVDRETAEKLPWQKSLFKGGNFVLLIIGVAAAVFFAGLFVWISFGAPPKEEKKNKTEKIIECKVAPRFSEDGSQCLITLPELKREKRDAVTPTLELVRVEPGYFEMGPAPDMDEHGKLVWRQTRPVTLKNAFYIGKTEVTQAQWMAVMGVKESGAEDGKAKKSYYTQTVDKKHPNGGDDLPVDTVSWDEAMAFCKKLNDNGFAPKGWMFTLPTETQWEFAARGGVKSRNFKYSGGNEIDEVAWCRSNNGHKDGQPAAPGAGRNRPVAQKKPNELGLYDMTGNVWEWCLDAVVKDEKGNEVVVPEFTCEADREEIFRRLRGGSWYTLDAVCVPTLRSRLVQGGRGTTIGLRLALVKAPEAAPAPAEKTAPAPAEKTASAPAEKTAPAPAK